MTLDCGGEGSIKHLISWFTESWHTKTQCLALRNVSAISLSMREMTMGLWRRWAHKKQHFEACTLDEQILSK